MKNIIRTFTSKEVREYCDKEIEELRQSGASESQLVLANGFYTILCISLTLETVKNANTSV